MKKYCKKPVVIKAIQWDGGEETYRKLVGIMSWYVARSGDVLFISTREGIMKASPGDWIIQGVAGEFYSCKQDIFSQTYEELGV